MSNEVDVNAQVVTEMQGPVRKLAQVEPVDLAQIDQRLRVERHRRQVM